MAVHSPNYTTPDGPTGKACTGLGDRHRADGPIEPDDTDQQMQQLRHLRGSPECAPETSLTHASRSTQNAG